jgi:hypothetical protein
VDGSSSNAQELRPQGQHTQEGPVAMRASGLVGVSFPNQLCSGIGCSLASEERC